MRSRWMLAVGVLVLMLSLSVATTVVAGSGPSVAWVYRAGPNSENIYIRGLNLCCGRLIVPVYTMGPYGERVKEIRFLDPQTGEVQWVVVPGGEVLTDGVHIFSVDAYWGVVSLISPDGRILARTRADVAPGFYDLSPIGLVLLSPTGTLTILGGDLVPIRSVQTGFLPMRGSRLIVSDGVAYWFSRMSDTATPVLVSYDLMRNTLLWSLPIVTHWGTFEVVGDVVLVSAFQRLMYVKDGEVLISYPVASYEPPLAVGKGGFLIRNGSWLDLYGINPPGLVLRLYSSDDIVADAYGFSANGDVAVWDKKAHLVAGCKVVDGGCANRWLMNLSEYWRGDKVYGTGRDVWLKVPDGWILGFNYRISPAAYINSFTIVKIIPSSP